MSHSNHYFSLDPSPLRSIDLISRTEEYSNAVQMVVKGPVYGMAEHAEIGIFLSEEEQDILIAGILERRGISAIETFAAIYQLRDNAVAGKEISSDGSEQSIISPAQKKST